MLMLYGELIAGRNFWKESPLRGFSTFKRENIKLKITMTNKYNVASVSCSPIQKQGLRAPSFSDLSQVARGHQWNVRSSLGAFPRSGDVALLNKRLLQAFDCFEGNRHKWIDFVDFGQKYREVFGTSVNRDLKNYVGGRFTKLMEYALYHKSTPFKVRSDERGSFLCLSTNFPRRLRDGVHSEKEESGGDYARFIDSVAEAKPDWMRSAGDSPEQRLPLETRREKPDSKKRRIFLTTFAEKRCYIDTCLLMTPDFWVFLEKARQVLRQEGKEIDCWTFASSVHELKAHQDADSLSVHTNDAAERARDAEIKLKKFGVHVASNPPGCPYSYADPAFVKLAETANRAVSIITNDNKLAEEILKKGDEKFVSLYSFPLTRKELFRLHKIEVDE